MKLILPFLLLAILMTAFTSKFYLIKLIPFSLNVKISDAETIEARGSKPQIIYGRAMSRVITSKMCQNISDLAILRCSV